MTQWSSNGRSTRVSRRIDAPRDIVYRAFLEPEALATWLPPDDMKAQVHVFEPREGGEFRLSLTYQNPAQIRSGKTTADTDTVQGKFTQLEPGRKVVWETEFDSDQPDFAGVMRITWSLDDVDAGTEATVLCDGIPTGVGLEDNEAGSRSSLHKLAAYVERARS